MANPIQSDWRMPSEINIPVNGKTVRVPEAGSLRDSLFQILSMLYALTGRNPSGAVFQGDLSLGTHRIKGGTNSAAPTNDEFVTFGLLAAAGSPAIAAMAKEVSKQLAAGGKAPLSLQGLHGVPANPVLTGIPVLTTLPDPNNPTINVTATPPQLVVFLNTGGTIAEYRLDVTVYPPVWRLIGFLNVAAPALFADGETPAGAINGVNVTFTLAFSPSPALSLELFENGLVQKQGGDYTLAGNTITFTNAPPNGTILVCWYRH